MGLTIKLSELPSRAARKLVGEKGNGIRKIRGNIKATGSEDNWFFDITKRLTGWLFNVAGAFIQWSLGNLAIWIVQGAIALYYFDWNQSDRAIEARIKSNNLALVGSVGTLAGTAIGWLVCGAVAAAVEFSFPVLRGKVVVELASEGKDEILGAVRAFLTQSTQTLGNNALLWAYSDMRKRLNSNGDYNKEGAKPYILSEKAEKSVESIGDEYLRTFARSGLEALEDSLIDCFYTMGYLIKMGVDDHYATTKQATVQSLGIERTIELTPDKETPDETIRVTGRTELLKTSIQNTLSTHKIFKNRDVGAIIGQPALDYATARPLMRSLLLVFRGKEKPPYNTRSVDSKGKTISKEVKQVEVTIPDPVKGITWSRLKDACARFTWGAHCCTVRLDNGRQMMVYGATKSEAETTMKKFVKLTTAEVLSWKFHEEGSKKSVALIKKPTVVYPSYATLVIRKQTGDGTADQTIDGKKLKETQQRIEIWRDSPPEDFKPLP